MLFNLSLSVLINLLILAFIYISDTCTAFQCKNIFAPFIIISTTWILLIISLIDRLKFLKSLLLRRLIKIITATIILGIGICNIINLKFAYTLHPQSCSTFAELVLYFAIMLASGLLLFALLAKIMPTSKKLPRHSIKIICALLIIFEIILHIPHQDVQKLHSQINQAILWKTKLSSTNKVAYDEGKCANHFRDKDIDLNILSKLNVDKTTLPNIVMLMSDALRSSQNSPEIMPYLNSQPGIHAQNHFSSSNCTRFSIFSLLTGSDPIFYRQYKNEKITSDLISFLQALGYKIHFILGDSFYNSRDVLDINNNSITKYGFDRNSSGYKYDTEWAFNLLQNKFSSEEGPNLFLVLTYGTHNDYYFPDYINKFSPIIELGKFSINKLKTFGSNDKDLITKLRNRYNNASYYFDLFVEKFVNDLKNKGQYDNTILMVFGDHGEEFAESNDTIWGHGSALNSYQLKSLMYMKFPGDTKKLEITQPTFHNDILVTIMSYLDKNYHLELQGIKKQKGKNIRDTKGITKSRSMNAYACGNETPSMFCTIKNGNIHNIFTKFDRSEIESKIE